MKTRRYLQHTDKARIEHDLTLTRIGELSIRDGNSLIKGLLYPAESVDAVILRGLVTTLNAGFDLDVSIPAIAIQNVGDGLVVNDVSFALDENSDTAYSVTIDAADGSNDRIDIVEARIEVRSEFTDLSTDVVDPVTKVITPTTRDRDFEVYINVQKVTGTPAPSPVAPSPTAATAGSLTGTVQIPTTIDLSVTYLLNIAIGTDGEFIAVDCRGATPSLTTLAEIISNINTAFAAFGTIATASGSDELILTAPGTGENSILKFKQPLDSSADAYTAITGNSIVVAYYDVFQGSNAFFKIAEVLVPTAAGALLPGNIFSRLVKDTSWTADAATIENGFDFDGHRKSNPLDHAAGSIQDFHLAPSVLDVVGAKTTLFRKERVYGYTASLTELRGTLYGENILPFGEQIEVVAADGNSQLLLDQEQEFPLSRVDQREESIAGSGYSVPVSLIEDAANSRAFVVGAAVSDGTNDYTVQNFAGNHVRVGIYITNGAATTGFTDLRITLHDAGNNVEATADIPIADLQSVDVGWIYVDMVATLTVSQTYHYHFEMVGEVSPTPPVLANASGTAASSLTFREMYGPTGGKYGTVNQDDIVDLYLNEHENFIFPTRVAADDNITTPGTGFAGETGVDMMAVDFSNDAFWASWRYQDYIGIDLLLGRIKIPPNVTVSSVALRIGRLLANFNAIEGVMDQDAKTYLRHLEPTGDTEPQSIDSGLLMLDRDFRGHQIEVLRPDSGTSISQSTDGVNDTVDYPNVGTPTADAIFLAKEAGINLEDPIRLKCRAVMSATATPPVDDVTIDVEYFVDNVSVGVQSVTFSETTTNRFDLELPVLDNNQFTRWNSIVARISRDNTISDNHPGDFKMITLYVDRAYDNK